MVIDPRVLGLPSDVASQESNLADYKHLEISSLKNGHSLHTEE